MNYNFQRNWYRADIIDKKCRLSYETGANNYVGVAKKIPSSSICIKRKRKISFLNENFKLFFEKKVELN